MMKRLIACLLVCMSLASCACAETIVYGQSEMGRDLLCHRLGNGENCILMVFAVHGFEGARDHDGEILVEIAQRIIAHFEANPEKLEGFELCIIPCANPDGLIDGKGEDRIGRMNAKGIDINRDFPVQWRKKTTVATQRTGEEPFSTAEARAIRDLVYELQPDCGIDVHGWINGVYGGGELSRVFHEAFGFPEKKFGNGGMTAQWFATQMEDAVMVELPARPGRKGYVDDNAPKMIEALESWMQYKRAPEV